MTSYKMITAAFASVALAGCVTGAEGVDRLMASQEPPSAALRKTIVSAARDYLADPYSIRDVEISGFMSDRSLGVEVVCVKFNAKNQVGGYTGRSAVAVNLKDGQPIRANENALGCRDPRLKYYPFPESDVLRRL